MYHLSRLRVLSSGGGVVNMVNDHDSDSDRPLHFKNTFDTRFC